MCVFIDNESIMYVLYLLLVVIENTECTLSFRYPFVSIRSFVISPIPPRCVIYKIIMCIVVVFVYCIYINPIPSTMPGIVHLPPRSDQIHHQYHL